MANPYELEIAFLQNMLFESRNCVFFGGAGVSTESGIPDFRSQDGLYSQKYSHPPETIISYSYYTQNKKAFYSFYKEKMLFPDALPNPAHIKLAEWEKAGKISAVITQNIDGLHQKAGSRNVIELHGSVHRNTCQSCKMKYPLSFILQAEGVPVCECGGDIKPDVVLYEEPLDSATVEKAIRALSRADLLIIGGTSLIVHPAAGLIQYFKGKNLAVVNKSALPSANARVVITDSIGKVFSLLT